MFVQIVTLKDPMDLANGLVLARPTVMIQNQKDVAKKKNNRIKDSMLKVRILIFFFNS